MTRLVRCYSTIITLNKMSSNIFVLNGLILVFTATLVLNHNSINAENPCCSPEKWIGHLIEKTGEYNSKTDHASRADVSSLIFYDYSVKKLAVNYFIRNSTSNTESAFQRIIDYGKGVEWKIQGDECTHAQISDNMTQPCFLEGAASFGSHDLYGSPVNTYYKEYTSGETLRVTMGMPACLFVTETRVSAGPDYRISFGIYENITGGYVPPTAFDVPKICKTSSPAPMQRQSFSNMWPWRYPY